MASRLFGDRSAPLKDMERDSVISNRLLVNAHKNELLRAKEQRLLVGPPSEDWEDPHADNYKKTLEKTERDITASLENLNQPDPSATLNKIKEAVRARRILFLDFLHDTRADSTPGEQKRYQDVHLNTEYLPVTLEPGKQDSEDEILWALGPNATPQDSWTLDEIYQALKGARREAEAQTKRAEAQTKRADALQMRVDKSESDIVKIKDSTGRLEKTTTETYQVVTNNERLLDHDRKGKSPRLFGPEQQTSGTSMEVAASAMRNVTISPRLPRSTGLPPGFGHGLTGIGNPFINIPMVRFGTNSDRSGEVDMSESSDTPQTSSTLAVPAPTSVTAASFASSSNTTASTLNAQAGLVTLAQLPGIFAGAGNGIRTPWDIVQALNIKIGDGTKVYANYADFPGGLDRAVLDRVAAEFDGFFCNIVQAKYVSLLEGRVALMTCLWLRAKTRGADKEWDQNFACMECVRRNRICLRKTVLGVTFLAPLPLTDAPKIPFEGIPIDNVRPATATPNSIDYWVGDSSRDMEDPGKLPT